jgi:hypothetical protein
MTCRGARRFVRAGCLAATLCAAALAASACDSPLGPDGFTLAGNWSGTWTFVAAGATVTDTVAVTFSQNQSAATGTWTAESGPSGELTITARTVTTGTLTITQTTLVGDTCSATTAVSGTASGEAIELTVADIPPGGSCQWATGQRFSLTR